MHKQAACEAVQPVGGVAGTDNFFLLRTAAVSSVPPESSHTASAAMLGQLGRLFVWQRFPLAMTSRPLQPPIRRVFHRASLELPTSVIVPLTIREILDERLAMKLA